jgi:hypothetical protein
MNEVHNDRSPNKSDAPGPASKSKRPYMKPSFQHEKVFETMALACGKLNPTQHQCRHNRKAS